MCTFSLELASLGTGVVAACWVADHAEDPRAARAGSLQKAKAGKSDSLCILNKPLTWTQEAASS